MKLAEAERISVSIEPMMKRVPDQIVSWLVSADILDHQHVAHAVLELAIIQSTRCTGSHPLVSLIKFFQLLFQKGDQLLPIGFRQLTLVLRRHLPVFHELQTIQPTIQVLSSRRRLKVGQLEFPFGFFFIVTLRAMLLHDRQIGAKDSDSENTQQQGDGGRKITRHDSGRKLRCWC